MPLPDLETILGTRTKIRFLRAFALLDEPVSGREAQRLADVASSSSATAALHDLVESGILRREEVGRSHLYRVNREHRLWDALARLFQAERGLDEEARRVVEEELGVEGCAPPLAVIVLLPPPGSAAEPATDLLVVADGEPDADRLRGALPRALDRARARLGASCRAEVRSRSALLHLRDRDDPLLTRALGAGRELLERALGGSSTR